MASEAKNTTTTTKAAPTPKKEAAVTAAPAKAAEATPAKAADATPAASAEASPAKAADAAPTSYSRGEGQKPVTQAYKDNWNAIFATKKTVTKKTKNKAGAKKKTKARYT